MALAAAYINVCSKLVEGRIHKISNEEILEMIKDEFINQRNSKKPKPDGVN
jgi:hypothetical protein